MSLLAQLQHFGLSEKEGRVYAAALELGPSPVQVISKKAGVNRATTYVQIASLSSRGLMTTYEQGKKRFFVAESPERLSALYEEELHILRDKERALQELLPELKRLRPSAGMPTVRLFEGQDGLEMARQELLHAANKEIVSVIGLEHYAQVVPQESRVRQFYRVKKAEFRGRVILCAKNPAEFKRDEEAAHFDRRVVASVQFDFPGEFVAFDDKVVLLTYKSEPVAVMIESKTMADMMRSLFNMAWEKVKNDRRV